MSCTEAPPQYLMIQWKSWTERIVNEEIKNRGKGSVLADIMHYC